MHYGAYDGGDDDGYEDYGGDDEDDDALACLLLKGLLLRLVHLAIPLEGVDRIHILPFFRFFRVCVFFFFCSRCHTKQK